MLIDSCNFRKISVNFNDSNCEFSVVAVAKRSLLGWVVLSMLGFTIWFCFTARVIMDRETGRSRGFGFVHYDSVENASEALSAMDGQVRNRMFLRELNALIPELYTD